VRIWTVDWARGKPARDDRKRGGPLSDSRPAAVVVLAAGAGTRMKSATPKVLHSIGGRTLLHHAIEAAVGLDPSRIVVVVRHERDAVVAHLSAVAPGVVIADQDQVPGTGRAVACALAALDASAGTPVTGTILVTSGDVPLVDTGILAALLEAHAARGSQATILTALVDDPGGYGRIIRDVSSGDVLRIVEQGDATDDERELNEINAGLYAFNATALREALKSIGTDNAQAEMYLTDVVSQVRESGGHVGAIICEDAQAVEGVNDREQLARAGAALNRRILEGWMVEGVTILDPATTWIDVDVILSPDVTLLPGTHLSGTTMVGSNAIIGPDTSLTDVVVGEDASVIRSHGSGARIGDGATVGPFSFLRPGTELGVGGKIGAFVETKNAHIGTGSKVPHLSYVGDVTIGEETNIGAGTIVANYDGVKKHHTTIGDNVRIGSDNTLVAPVTIGDGAYTGAGTTVRKDVPSGALAINPAPQENREGWVGEHRPGSPAAEAASRARHSTESTGKEGRRGLEEE
jgi:bifunctional UDP-N-acetylglucosamine pyrophosphorylase / glucosamine-1-phosphate N-acetyltransferase